MNGIEFENGWANLMLTNKWNNMGYTKVLGSLFVCYDCHDKITVMVRPICLILTCLGNKNFYIRNDKIGRLIFVSCD